MKKLYTIGNSHAHFFTFTEPGRIGWSTNFLPNKYNIEVRSCSIGPTTAFKFGIKHLPLMLTILQDMHISDNDYILIPVGEVDCRLHLPKQAFIQKRDINEIVDECLDKFFNVLLVLKKLNYNPIAWGGHPSTDAPGDDETYPRYADTHFRNTISRLWDRGLEERARRNNIRYASIFEQLIDEKLMPKKGIFQDGCHLKYESMILDIALREISCVMS